jgi:hypothetical protein
MNGIGITATPAKGIAIMKQVADQGFATAQFNYAASVEWEIENACM